MSDKQGLPTGKHTLVEEGTEFTGKMSSSCPIVVMGKVEGEISGPVIHITPTGVVSGIVKVKTLRSDGELAGEVEADTVEISGRVRDRTVIRARSLEVSLSTTKGGMQVVFGECELAVGDEPNKEAAIAAALSPPTATAPAPEAKTAPVDAKAAPAGKASPVDARAGKTPAPAPALAADAATSEPVDADGKRRRGTIPPPSPT
jgi:cytoskeletal protein CcmA (bactofilin family)